MLFFFFQSLCSDTDIYSLFLIISYTQTEGSPKDERMISER